jgi:LacI family transcriptional regulator
MVSMKSVAALAGVSVATVSYVLNDPSKVRPETLERVLKAIDELGYVRNEAARHLRAGRSRSVGFIVYDITNPYFGEMLAGFESVVEDHSMRALLMNSAQSEAREASSIVAMRELRAEGVVIAPLEPSLDVAQLRRMGTSVVIADRIEPTARFCSVACDDIKGGGLQARHLFEQGHRRLAYVGGPLSRAHLWARLTGFRAELVGKPVELTVIETDSLSFENGRRAAEQVAEMAGDERPTAVACANDIIALGALQGFMSLGMAVPDEVALIGYDDISYAAAAAIPLSAIRQPAQDIGNLAAQLMFEEIAAREAGDNHVHRRVLVQPELVVRASTRPSPASAKAAAS